MPTLSQLIILEWLRRYPDCVISAEDGITPKWINKNIRPKNYYPKYPPYLTGYITPRCTRSIFNQLLQAGYIKPIDNSNKYQISRLGLTDYLCFRSSVIKI